jgi:hypothetical protein
MLPNRIAVYFTAAAALAAALVPVIANLDLTSTIGIVGGVGAFAGVIAVWLNGWSRYEERVAIEEMTAGQTQTGPGQNPGG